MPSFGERLTYFRKYILGLSRESFSEKYDIPPRTLRVWEGDEFNISQRMVNKLKNELHKHNTPFNEDWLFNGKGEPPSKNEINWPSFKADRKKKAKGKRFTYLIESADYEPILKENTELLLEPVQPDDLTCPNMVALKNTNNNMHFGIAYKTIDDKYFVLAYKNENYIISLSDNDEIYEILNIMQDKS